MSLLLVPCTLAFFATPRADQDAAKTPTELHIRIIMNRWGRETRVLGAGRYDLVGHTTSTWIGDSKIASLEDLTKKLRSQTTVSIRDTKGSKAVPMRIGAGPGVTLNDIVRVMSRGHEAATTRIRFAADYGTRFPAKKADKPTGRPHEIELALVHARIDDKLPIVLPTAIGVSTQSSGKGSRIAGNRWIAPSGRVFPIIRVEQSGVFTFADKTVAAAAVKSLDNALRKLVAGARKAMPKAREGKDQPTAIPTVVVRADKWTEAWHISKLLDACSHEGIRRAFVVTRNPLANDRR